MINAELHTKLEDIFADVAQDDVNEVVTTSTGRTFCSDGDIKGIDSRQSASRREYHFAMPIGCSTSIKLWNSLSSIRSSQRYANRWLDQTD